MNTTMERSASPGVPRNRAAAPDTDLDVLIVGAGLSGIGAAYHLRERCPSARFTILEGRESIGGTWDLFRYPGIWFHPTCKRDDEHISERQLRADRYTDYSACSA